MTGFLHEKEFSRKTFLKGGGAVVVGFALAGAGLAGKACAAADPTRAAAPPDANQLDSWLAINADNTVIAQDEPDRDRATGSRPGSCMVAAEELDMDMSQLRHVAHTGRRSNPSSTRGPSTRAARAARTRCRHGPQIRAAAAAARRRCSAWPRRSSAFRPRSLRSSKGVVSGGGKTVTYGAARRRQALQRRRSARRRPERRASRRRSRSRNVQARSPSATWSPRDRHPGEGERRRTRTSHNIRVPGHAARPRRPAPRPGRVPYNSNVAISVDEKLDRPHPERAGDPGRRLPRRRRAEGVRRDPGGRAAEGHYNDNPILPGNGNLWKRYARARTRRPDPARVSAQTGDVDAALQSAAKTSSGSFAHHYQGHMPIGPACAIADVQQRPRDDLQQHAERAEPRHRAGARAGAAPAARRSASLFYEGSGSFGNGASHVRHGRGGGDHVEGVGKPVRVQFMRWDEQGWTHYAPASLVDVRGGVDANGNIVAYDWTQWTQGGDVDLHLARAARRRPGSPTPTANTIPTSVAGGTANTENTSPWMKVSKARTGWSRSRCRRRRHLPNGRGPRSGRTAGDACRRAAHGHARRGGEHGLARVPAPEHEHGPISASRRALGRRPPGGAQAAGWKPWVAGSKPRQTGDVVTGRGIANSHHGGSYAASVADIQVNKKTGKITCLHVYAAQDAGLTVNPNLVENQMLGSH